MPSNQVIKVENFEGLAGTHDPTDIPPGAGVFVDGLDLQTAPGKFIGLKDDGTIVAGTWARNLVAAVGFRSSGDMAAYNITDDKFYLLAGLDTGETPTAATAIGSAQNASAICRGGVSDGFGIHMAMGRGFIPQYLFNDGTNWQAVPAILEAPAPSSVTSYAVASLVVVGDGNKWQSSNDPSDTDPGSEYPFKQNVAYVYGLSYIFEGKQEGPLFIDTTPFLIPDDDYEQQLDITITRPGSSPNVRITHMCIYRASTGITRDITEGINQVGTYDPTRGDPYGGFRNVPWTRVTTTVDLENIGEFTLVEVIACSWGGTNDDSRWAAGTTDKVTINDDYKIGSKFPDRTGFPSTLEHMNLSWDLGVIMDGRHVIANVEILQGTEDDAVMATQLIASRRGMYSVFNWPSAYYDLPTRLSAMVTFQERLWCFDTGKCYVLNSALGPHHEIEGIGCVGHKSIVATESGMMVAADRQVWFHDRRGFQDIGTPIMEIVNNSGTDLGYLQKVSADDPCCAYDSHYNLFILTYRVSTSTIISCLYNPALQRWSMMEVTGGTTLSLAITAPTGRVFLNVASALHKLFSESTTRATEFISKDFEFDPYQTKFFEIAVRGDKPTLTWSEDGATAFSVTLTTDSLGVHRGIINSSPRTVAGTQWKPTAKGRFRITQAADKSINDFSIVYRVMEEPVVA